MPPPRFLFFIGKGGVGKSTTSALAAIYLSCIPRNTLLVSMDPAHNLRDIFELDFSEKPRRISDHLLVKEVSTDHWIKKYLKETQDHIKETYRYQSAFNLQNYFNVLQFSPGLEEYALLLAFEDIIHTYDEQDVIVFDMAPTALTLRFFSLPFITLIWLEELLKLRKEIYNKKEIISKIKLGKLELEQDKVKAKLVTLIRNYEHLQQHFLSDQTNIHLVLNNDKLSFSEAFRIRGKLKEIGMIVHTLVLNKVSPEDRIDEIADAFKSQKIVKIPLAPRGLTGLGTLEDFIRTNRTAFEDMERLPVPQIAVPGSHFFYDKDTPPKKG